MVANQKVRKKEFKDKLSIKIKKKYAPNDTVLKFIVWVSFMGDPSIRPDSVARADFETNKTIGG